MARKQLITTGLSGLVGSRFQKDFESKYEFQNLDLSNPVLPVDITNREQIFNIFEKSSAEYVLHLAAHTNVTAAWEQRNDTSGITYQVNVLGTKNIVEACRKTKKHLIHISTAYVFDGKNENQYTEDDSPNPIEWYGETKFLAEELVRTLENNWTILRIDQPFRSDTYSRPDILRRIISGIQNQSLYPQFTNHFFGPTFIDDFSKVIDWVIRTHAQGIFHASSGEKWSDFEFASMVNEVLNLHGKISEGDLNQYLKTLERPYQRNTSMNCEKLRNSIDFSFTKIKDAVKMAR